MAEKRGLELREELESDLSQPLDHIAAFALLPHVSVAPHGEIPAAAVFIEHLRTAGAGSWSGLSMPLEDGRELVIYNDAHPLTRTRATLMEEFFHIRLGHPRSAVRLLAAHAAGRTFNAQVEDEAYQSGAAALVPYWALRQAVDSGHSAHRIAKQFHVSRDLVLFRSKVTRCYKSLRRG
jgi:Zn-dependent peptidase ImmA (M78 family)